jgi:DNA-binding IclR family transcriptional regulator
MNRESDGEAKVVNVRAVQRAMAILKSFSGRPSQSLAEVTQATGLDKGTARRLLITLMGDGFIALDPATQRYALGRIVRTLAADVGHEVDLRSVAVPVLSAIAAELHFTAFLSVYRDRAAICLERVHDMKGMEVRWWALGGTLPLNCGGAPKVLLAYQSDEEIDRALAQPLEPLTPRSIMDPETLKTHLRVVRERGWEFAIDDVAVGLSALAVPIFDEAGGLICAISVSGLTPQMSNRGRPRHLGLLKSAAEQIQAKLHV